MVYRKGRDTYMEWLQMENRDAFQGCSVPDEPPPLRGDGGTEGIHLGGTAALAGGGGGYNAAAVVGEDGNTL